MDTKKEELIKRLQQELDRRTAMELKAIHLISEGKYEEANNVLKSIDNRIIDEIYKKYAGSEELKDEYKRQLY